MVGHPTIGKPNNPAIHKVRVPGLEMSRATSTSADNRVVTWSAPITTKRSRMALVKVTSSLKNMRFARMSILASIGNCQQEFVPTKLHACKGAYVGLESIPVGRLGCGPGGVDCQDVDTEPHSTGQSSLARPSNVTPSARGQMRSPTATADQPTARQPPSSSSVSAGHAAPGLD